MSTVNRAVRNISRRKIRASLVIIALGFAMAIMISIPAGVIANQKEANQLAENLGNTINESGQTINETLTQIDCSLGSEFAGFGFQRSNATVVQIGPNGRTSGEGDFVFDPSQFGGGYSDGSGRFGSAFGGKANPMNESLYANINATLNDVAAVAPMLEASESSRNQTQTIMGRTFTTSITDYTIKGIPLTSDLVNYAILPTNITEGRNLQAGDSNVVVLSENNSKFFNAGVGDTISILGQDFTVVGIHGTNSVSDTLTLYMNLSDAQTITNNTGYITSIRVFADNSDTVSQVANDIRSLHPELTVTTGQERLSQLQSMQSAYNTALESAQASISSTQTVAIQEIIIVVAATSLIVLFVMLFTVRERTKEIGTLKAIGFSNKTVMGQFLLEGVFLSLIAGVVGVAIATIAAPTLSSVLLPSVNALGAGGPIFTSSGGPMAATAVNTVSISTELILLAFGASVLLGALGSMYPAWRAAKIRPAEAMRYE